MHITGIKFLIKLLGNHTVHKALKALITEKSICKLRSSKGAQR
jgi:hypothetical protein